MSEQILIQFRADKTLKQEVAAIYEQLGMDLPTALRIFLVKSKLANGLPFEATLPEFVTREQALKAFHKIREEAQSLPEMTLDDINAEIAAVRTKRK